MRIKLGWVISVWAVGLLISMWLPWQAGASSGIYFIASTGGSIGLNSHWFGQTVTLLSSVLLVLGAMLGQELFSLMCASSACIISFIIMGLLIWYERTSIFSSIRYGFYLGLFCVLLAIICSLWVLVISIIYRNKDN